MRATPFVACIGVLGVLLPATPASAAPTCFGKRATIVGTPGDDRLVGTGGRDVIVGRGGDDVILGRGGRDRICGGDAGFVDLTSLTGGGGIYLLYRARFEPPSVGPSAATSVGRDLKDTKGSRVR